MIEEHVTVLIGVGPAVAELERLFDLVEALRYWEPLVQSIVLIDDAPQPRGLGQRIAKFAQLPVHCLPHPRRGVGSGVFGGLTEGILLGLKWIALHQTAATTVLKIDTDGLVIAPFAQRCASVLATDARLGLLGLYDRHCSGEPRSFDPWDRAARHYSQPIGVHWRTPAWRRRIRWQLSGRAGRQRAILKRARARGYAWGEHCLGGAYLLRAQAVRDMSAQGLLDDAAFWRPTLMSEDVTVGAYMKAAGWNMASFAAPGEVFGLAHQGLPFAPEELLAKGYGIIHAVKNDRRFPEAQIRAFFRERRHASCPLPTGLWN